MCDCENYYHRPMFEEDTCCGPHKQSPWPCDCEDGLHLYTRNDCCPNHSNPCCEPSFSHYLCEFINKKVIITIGCRRIRVVILEVSCSTVKCLVLGSGKMIFLNVDHINNVRPLCY